jgi:hypothetical protein
MSHWPTHLQESYILHTYMDPTLCQTDLQTNPMINTGYVVLYTFNLDIS